MAELKSRLRSDLTKAMKSQDKLRTATLRMVLAAIQTEEVSGKQAKELTDDEVLKVLARESRKRGEAAEIYTQNGRGEMAANEHAEARIIDEYLPTPLTEAELADVVDTAIAQVAEQLGQRPHGTTRPSGTRPDNPRGCSACTNPSSSTSGNRCGPAGRAPARAARTSEPRDLPGGRACSMNATWRQVLAPSIPVLSKDIPNRLKPSSGTSFHSLQATSQALHPMQIEVSVKNPTRGGWSVYPASPAGSSSGP